MSTRRFIDLAFDDLKNAPAQQPTRRGGLIEKGRRVRDAIDDAHLTAQYIEELRQRIDAGVSEIRAYSGLGGSVPGEVAIFYCMQRGAKTQRVKTPAPDPDA
jgi:hypothetical protein